MGDTTWWSIEDVPTQSCLEIFLLQWNVLIIFVLLNSIAQYLFKKYESIIEVHMSNTLIPLFLWKYYWKYNNFEML